MGLYDRYFQRLDISKTNTASVASAPVLDGSQQAIVEAELIEANEKFDTRTELLCRQGEDKGYRVRIPAKLTNPQAKADFRISPRGRKFFSISGASFDFGDGYTDVVFVVPSKTSTVPALRYYFDLTVSSDEGSVVPVHGILNLQANTTSDYNLPSTAPTIGLPVEKEEDCPDDDPVITVMAEDVLCSGSLNQVVLEITDLDGIDYIELGYTGGVVSHYAFEQTWVRDDAFAHKSTKRKVVLDWVPTKDETMSLFIKAVDVRGNCEEGTTELTSSCFASPSIKECLPKGKLWEVAGRLAYPRSYYR